MTMQEEQDLEAFFM